MGQAIPLSFEFFPPKTPVGEEKLLAVAEQLCELQPEFCSVTYGAGGSTQDKTLSTVLALRAQLGMQQSPIVPHLSCIGSEPAQLLQLLKQYQHHQIDQLVLLRGDLPSGMGGYHSELRYGSDLVKFVRTHTGDHFYINVAAYPEFHPQATVAFSDLDHFKLKITAGANRAITQFFYNPDSYYRFLESCAALDIDVPIIPGIMPIQNFSKLKQFAANCGAEIPRWLMRRMEAYGDDSEAIRAYGIEVVIGLCEDLISFGAPGLHFYTLNQLEPTWTICQALRG